MTNFFEPIKNALLRNTSVKYDIWYLDEFDLRQQFNRQGVRFLILSDSSFCHESMYLLACTLPGTQVTHLDLSGCSFDKPYALDELALWLHATNIREINLRGIKNIDFGTLAAALKLGLVNSKVIKLHVDWDRFSEADAKEIQNIIAANQNRHAQSAVDYMSSEPYERLPWPHGLFSLWHNATRDIAPEERSKPRRAAGSTLSCR